MDVLECTSLPWLSFLVDFEGDEVDDGEEGLDDFDLVFGFDSALDGDFERWTSESDSSPKSFDWWTFTFPTDFALTEPGPWDSFLGFGWGKGVLLSITTSAFSLNFLGGAGTAEPSLFPLPEVDAENEDGEDEVLGVGKILDLGFFGTMGEWDTGGGSEEDDVVSGTGTSGEMSGAGRTDSTGSGGGVV